MTIVNIFGVLSLMVIIVVVIQQYLDVISEFSDFQTDLSISGWPTWYMNSISLVIKNSNIQTLVKANNFYLTSGATMK